MAFPDDQITRFVGHFQDQIGRIATVTDPMFRQLLYATMLDPLARAAYGKNGHRVNLQRLVEQLTPWDSRLLVSLPQLQLRLRTKKRSRFRLAREVNRRLTTWGVNRFPATSASPSFTELDSYAASSDRPWLQSSTYAALFCAYRNNLVHEFRAPGNGIDWAGRKCVAFYQRSSSSAHELVFPVGLFEYIARNALDGVERHLRSTRINPYSQFELDPFWRFK